ncbi:hypothetical protein SCG7109_AL_00060 [Chlamydiales bacterium SCGC AG-110-M15]|nr:hypothetical protein SCG7109_AL_00060 [Chlamydiales bacterium SCGC AG-110-M15]
MDLDTPFETLSKNDQKCIKNLSCSIIHSLRQVKDKSLENLYVQDVNFLLEIQQRLNELPPEELSADNEWHFLQSIATETKEFILMHESEEERKVKNRPSKNDFSKDFVYLTESFHLFMYMFEQQFAQLEKKYPDVPPFIINMQVIQDMSMKKPFKIPTMRKIRIINKHKRTIEQYMQNISEKYELLPPELQEQVKELDYFLISLWGTKAVRYLWSKVPCLKERANLPVLGESLEKTQSVLFDGFPENDPLSSYIKAVHQFLTDAESTEDFTGTKTMFASLYYYLMKSELAPDYQPFNETKNLKKIFSLFSNHVEMGAS